MELSILRIKSALASKFVRSTVIRCAFYHNKSWDLDSEELDEYNSGRPSYSERRPDRRSNFSDRNYNDRRYSDNRGFRDSRSSFAGGTLSKVDWSTVNLTPWNKDLYTPSENILQLRPEDVEEYRKKHNMSVKGTDIPYPIQSFEDYNFPNEVQRMIRESGFQAPTPIQAQGWPIALSGRDFIGIGETGSGKTLGYTMPGLVHIRNQAPVNENDGPIGLVMAPTRELVQQINEVAFQTFGRDRNAIACLFGGASKNIQARQLYRKPSLCIATPGRLLDFLEMGVTNLRRCTYLVLDEADRMLDMGFEPQIRKIVDQIRPDRQTLMWSATWPKEVQALAQDYLEDYIQLNVGSLDLVANPNITQSLKMCNPFEKNDVFIQLMREEMENGANKILVFCQTKSQVDFIARRLYKEGIRARGLHGDHSQASRDNTLHEFRIGRTHVLVATDVASRGLDVNDISLVVNYDVPNDIESYIHRIGRTGRAGKEGRALSLLTEKDADIAKELIRVLKEAKQEIPEDLYELMEIGSSMRRSKKKYGGGYRQRSYQYSGNRRQY